MLSIRGALALCVFAPAFCLMSGSVTGVAQCRSDQRRVTVADSIAMSEVMPADSHSATSPDAPGLFSPDGRRFAVVLRHGDLRNNTNIFSLFVYSTERAFSSKRPDRALEMASNSNRPAIADLHWLRDGRTLYFLGEQPGLAAQVYSFDVITGGLHQLTRAATSVVSFDVSDDGRVLVFEAEPVAEDILDTPQTRKEGFVVAGEELSTLLFSGYRSSLSTAFVSRQLFLKIGSAAPRRIPLNDGIWPGLTLSVAPNGRYALVEAYARQVPADWMRYGEGVLHEYISARKRPGALSLVETYLLLDTAAGQLSSLLGTPKDWPHDGFLWLDRGRSLVVSESFLPLTGAGAEQQSVTEKHPSVVEIEFPARKSVPIDSDPLNAVRWDETTRSLLLEGRGSDAAIRRLYRKTGGRWERLESRDLPKMNAGPEVTVRQGMNIPPTIWLADTSRSRAAMLLDPNPQFAHLCFGQEREIHWNATDGHPLNGGLYLPPDYSRAERYPLVIQTHAFDDHLFWVDGPWHSAYAAQELAAKGIAVLQMGYDHVGRSTPAEAPRAMAAIEGAIDALSKEGIIDRDRVGIMGFSRTVYHVAYTLTHSSYPIAAATLADGFDGDYFQAIAFGMTEAPDAIAVNGASPWGAGLEKWLERSPLFAVDRVSSPVRLEAYGMDSVLGLWGWYSLLSRRNMPVDMIVLPHAPHLLVKPWERMASQQGDVDWFCYWLKGEQDSSQQKAAEYRRWRELRSLLDSRTAGRTGSAVQRGSTVTGAEPISSTALHPHL